MNISERDDDDAEPQEHANARTWTQQAFEPSVVPKMVKPNSKHGKPQSAQQGNHPCKLTQWQPMNGAVRVLVGARDSGLSAYDTGHPNQANPLRVTLSLGVVHAPPNEHWYADKNENQSKNGIRLPQFGPTTILPVAGRTPFLRRRLC